MVGSDHFGIGLYQHAYSQHHKAWYNGLVVLFIRDGINRTEQGKLPTLEWRFALGSKQHSGELDSLPAGFAATAGTVQPRRMATVIPHHPSHKPARHPGANHAVRPSASTHVHDRLLGHRPS